MTKTAHTEGPIAVDRYGTIMARDRLGGVDLFPISGVVLSDGEKARANRARFIALWNSCEGIANPDVVPELSDALKSSAMTLTEMANILDGVGLSGVASISRASVRHSEAILAKLEGRS